MSEKSFSIIRYLYPLLTIFLVGVFLLLLWLGTPIIKNRYFSSDSENETSIKNEKTDNEDEVSSDNQTSDDQSSKNNPSESTVEEDVDEVAPVEDTFLKISSKDCDNRCKNYSDSEEKKYCQEVCGLTEDTALIPNCSGLEDLEADYCYKNLAIEKKDAGFCQKISDTKIKKLCQNRVFEDAQDAMSSVAE